MLYGEESLGAKIAHQKELLVNLLCDQAVVYRASLAQQRLWFLYQLHTESAAYNVHLGMWLRGRLELSALRAALQQIVNRHESLRTSFRLEDNQVRQFVVGNLILNVSIEDLSNTADPTAEAYRLARQEVAQPFDIGQAPLFRARIFRITSEDHVLLCTMHHIITDSWSMQILARELSTLYKAFLTGNPSPLPALTVTYGDYSEWQRAWLNTAQLQQQLTYWKGRLENAPPVLELPRDDSRPAEQTFAGASQTVPLPGEIVRALKALSTRYQATPFMLLLAAFKALLYRYSAQPDLLVGVPVAGRNRIETEDLIGFFVNTVVLRDDLSGNPRFADLLLQVRETTLAAFANSDAPFEKIVEALKPERNLSYNPIFQVMFSTIKSSVRSNTFGNLTVYPYVVTPSTSIFDLFMSIIEAVDGQWWAQVDYNVNLFRPERIARMLQDYLGVLQAVLEDATIRILDLPIANSSSVASINRTRLTMPENRAEGSSNFAPETKSAATTTPEEHLLLHIWKRVLRRENLTIHDNFFDAGGHSLLAASLVADIQNATGFRVPVSAVFRAPTVAAISRLLGDGSLAEPEPTLVKLNKGDDSHVPLFTFALPQADSFGFGQLARHVIPVHPVYKVQAAAPVFGGRPLTKQEIRDLATKYIEAMRSVQSHGPYCLAAMCDAVLVAQEAILQLESAGQEVGLFVIFDTWVLENSQIPWLWAVDYYYQRLRNLYSASVSKKLTFCRRFLTRPFRRDEGRTRSGWRNAYWPGEDFQPPRFQAPVLLFKRPCQPYFYVRDPEMGWGERSRGGVEICEMHCGHVEMLREPFVSITGRVLGARLQKLSRNFTSLSPVALSPEDGAWLSPAA